ncbi:hypothetical protein AB0J90_20360 [Micromonospora sp. NPDC049523]|uniref:hypothetical protein n=1 Tax=Micromonospora sp. NPDC049523 TaxID=3155921 RepID=UPI003421C59D
MAGEEILAAVALTLATKASEALTEGGRAVFAALARLVKRRFQRDDAAQTALAEADPSDDTRIQSLREELAQTAAEDPVFDHELRRLWQDLTTYLQADSDGGVNNLSGSVGGNVVQARDVQAGVSSGNANSRAPETGA